MTALLTFPGSLVVGLAPTYILFGCGNSSISVNITELEIHMHSLETHLHIFLLVQSLSFIMKSEHKTCLFGKSFPPWTFSIPTELIPRTLGRFNVFILLNGLICLHGSKSVFERTLNHCTLKSVLDRSCVPDPAAGAQDAPSDSLVSWGRELLSPP